MFYVCMCACACVCFIVTVFSKEVAVSKQCRPRSDAANVCKIHQNGYPVYEGLITAN